jgi:hypothetical protein
MAKGWGNRVTSEEVWVPHFGPGGTPWSVGGRTFGGTRRALNDGP